MNYKTTLATILMVSLAATAGSQSLEEMRAKRLKSMPPPPAPKVEKLFGYVVDMKEKIVYKSASLNGSTSLNGNADPSFESYKFNGSENITATIPLTHEASLTVLVKRWDDPSKLECVMHKTNNAHALAKEELLLRNALTTNTPVQFSYIGSSDGCFQYTTFGFGKE